jgi:hypothetical protein
MSADHPRTVPLQRSSAWGSPLHGDAAERRRLDLLERLDWVIHRRLDELPDTLVAGLHAAGVACDRRSSAAALVERLRGGEPLDAGRRRSA